MIAAETTVTVPTPVRAPVQKQWNIAAAHASSDLEQPSLGSTENKVLKPKAVEMAKSSPSKAGRGKRKATYN